MSIYGQDLAHIHDTAFGDLARGAASTVARLLRREGIRDGLVIDLACGTGITAELLVEAGYDVLGVDVSEEQLAIARRRAPAARFEQRSLIDAELPPCVAICAIGEGFNYAFDERAGPDAARTLFERAHGALQPGGLLVFDVAERGRERRRPRRSWEEGDDWTICVEAWEEPDEDVLQRRIVSFRRSGRGWRRSHELHTLRLFERDALRQELQAAGFDARTLLAYGRYRFRRGHAGFAGIRR